MFRLRLSRLGLFSCGVFFFNNTVWLKAVSHTGRVFVLVLSDYELQTNIKHVSTVIANSLLPVPQKLTACSSLCITARDITHEHSHIVTCFCYFTFIFYLNFHFDVNELNWKRLEQIVRRSQVQCRYLPPGVSCAQEWSHSNVNPSADIKRL